jgi:hypothetical protein
MTTGRATRYFRPEAQMHARNLQDPTLLAEVAQALGKAPIARMRSVRRIRGSSMLLFN